MKRDGKVRPNRAGMTVRAAAELSRALAEDAHAPIDYERLFEQYAQHDPRGLLLIDRTRRILAINPAACTMLHCTTELSLKLSDVVRDVDVGFAVGEVLHDRFEVWHESYLPEPDRLLRFHFVPVLAPTGEPVLVIATVEDITRARHLETVRRDFVANVSHELRTPLASINLLVETLQMGAIEDREAAEHFLHRIEVETQAMARLVEELLELSRLESGSLRLAVERISVPRLLEAVAHRLQPSATDKGVDIHCDVQDDLPPVEADAARIEQVLMNLVHNAVKFTPSGGQVTMRARRQSRGVLIEVADTGVGMDDQEARRIFERFYKVDKGRNRAEGAGLGLAIARNLLELHGAQLHVVSEVGRGSRFSFALPVAADREGART